MNFLKARVTDGGLLKGRDFELRSSGAVRETLVVRKGDVIAGVRPEHLVPGRAADAGAGWIKGRVELIETLGSDLMVQAVGDDLVMAQFEREGPR